MTRKVDDDTGNAFTFARRRLDEEVAPTRSNSYADYRTLRAFKERIRACLGEVILPVHHG
jgi:hypothetical protein